MTYEKLLENCKKYIDKGEYGKLQRYIMSHSKQMLLHFNELQAELLEYGREVEQRRQVQ